MRTILLRTVIALMCIVVSGCYTSKTNISRDIAITDAVNVDNTDGINIEEALIIAKSYLFTTNDEPCRTLADKYNIGDPVFTNITYKNDYDVIMFKKIGFNVIGGAPLYVYVNYKSGAPICGGTKIQK